MTPIKAGQTLWYVETFRHGRYIDPPKQSEVVVTKVGRKFADLNTGDRMRLETMTIDAGQYTSPGKCFLSKDDYDATEGAVEAWRKLRADFSIQKPAGVTIADIQAARALLKI